MKSREEIITDMCHAYRNDYGLDKDPNGPSWIMGMTETERKGLWQTMSQIYDNDIAPIMEIKNGKSS